MSATAQRTFTPEHLRNLSRAAQKRGDRVRGIPRPANFRVRGGKLSLDKWQLNCLLVQGHTNVEIGKKLKVTAGAVHYEAKGLGYSGRRYAYSFGEPLNAEAVRTLQRISGLTTVEFAQLVGVPLHTIYAFSSPARKRQTLRPHVATKIIGWRKTFLQALLSAASKRKLQHVTIVQVLKTFFPDLQTKYNFLCDVMHHCRAFLNHPDPRYPGEDLQHWLCRQAMHETAHNSEEQPFVQFLPWSPELMPFLESNLDRLRGPGQLWNLASETIGSCFGAGRYSISYGIYYQDLAGSSPIPPREMRWLILATTQVAEKSASKSWPRPKGDPGRPKKTKENRQYFKVGQMVEQKLASGMELTAARRSVASAMGISYSSVVRYHKQFRSRLTRDGNTDVISITG